MTAPQKQKKGRSWPLWAGGVLVLAIVGWFVIGSGALGGAEEANGAAGATVQRGPLRISVSQRGNLSARDSHVLRSQIPGRTTVLWLIEEGTRVEEGDVVARLDASEQEDRRVVQDIAVQNARSNFAKAEQQLEIQISQNTSDIAAASQALEFAEIDHRKYIEGDWPQQLQEAEEAILLAQEELAQAKDRLEWSAKLESDGFLTRTELERDELAHQRSEILLDQAKRRKELLIQFVYPREEASLLASIQESKRELERVKLQSDARLVDYQVAVKSAEAKLKLESEQLAKLEEQIANATIRAPGSGMVVYGRDEGWRDDDVVAEGTEVRERQEVVTIPRQEGMIVEASLHESVLKMVRPGLPCIVRVDALKGRDLQGTVEFVAQLADKGSWWANPNQRLYRCEIAVHDNSADMRPDMSCEVEIVVEEIEDTLFVPVQAVVFDGGKTICFVNQAGSVEQRGVEVGRSSEKWAQILSGLKEDEVVLLAPPAGFVPKSDQKSSERRRPGGERAPGGGDTGDREGGRPAQQVGAQQQGSGADSNAMGRWKGGAGQGKPSAGTEAEKVAGAVSHSDQPGAAAEPTEPAQSAPAGSN